MRTSNPYKSCMYFRPGGDAFVFIGPELFENIGLTHLSRPVEDEGLVVLSGLPLQETGVYLSFHNTRILTNKIVKTTEIPTNKIIREKLRPLGKIFLI